MNCVPNLLWCRLMCLTCNSQLVHVLTSEGYPGTGLELRPRKTWPLYPPATQARLKKQAINPNDLLAACAADGGEGSPFPTGTFFIGNHADELTVRLDLHDSLTIGLTF